MNKDNKIYIAGHRGMVGSALLRKLEKEGYTQLIYRTSQELDLRNQEAVKQFFEQEQPEYVLIAAAKVGGIVANNTYKADFIYDNLMIQNNLIHHAYLNNVKKLLFLGSSCLYPKLAAQPLKESYLLSGYLEPTNEPYAIAKIAGIKMCEAYKSQHGCNFISAMPTSLYGLNDNFDLNNSHVIPAMMRKFHEAKLANKNEVVLWGSGAPLREFLHVDDLADAALFLMQHYNENQFVNIGSGNEISIKDLANIIKNVVGFEGAIVWDTTKPDGTPRKLIDSTVLDQMGWKAKISFEEGLKEVYQHHF